MSKVMTFSTTFQSYHPKAGQPTYFVEKLWAGWADQGHVMDGIGFSSATPDFLQYYRGVPKWHTIREGHRWKPGDKFSPRIWSKKAYRSPQVIIGPDIEVKKTWKISIINRSIYLEHAPITTYVIEEIAKNDGLSFDDLLAWFMPLKKKPVPDWHGQIICWNPKIEY